MGAACDASLRLTSNKPALLGTLGVKPPTEPPSLLLSSPRASPLRVAMPHLTITATLPSVGVIILLPAATTAPAFLVDTLVALPTVSAHAPPPLPMHAPCLAAAARAPPFMGILVAANSPVAGSTFAAPCLATHPPLKETYTTKLPATSLAKSLATPPLKSTLVASSPTTATRTILALPRMGTAIVKSPAITRV